MKEHVIYLESAPNLVGIVTTPSSPATSSNRPIFLLLNSGRLHRIGPNRLYVKIARQLAEQGITSCRFDFSGIGDSPSSDREWSDLSYLASETSRMMDHIAETMAIHQFVVFGICLGADAALHAAANDSRIIGAILVNGSVMDTPHANTFREAAKSRILRRYYRKRLFSPSSWSRLLSGQSNTWNLVLKAIKCLMEKKTKPSQETVEAKKEEAPVNGNTWKKFAMRNIPLSLVYSEGSTALDIFEMHLKKEIATLLKSSLAEVKIFHDADHVFTPLSSQRMLMDYVMWWMQTRFSPSVTQPPAALTLLQTKQRDFGS
jgi:pimeloyl-ACP methyl ester carboxylesterase